MTERMLLDLFFVLHHVKTQTLRNCLHPESRCPVFLLDALFSFLSSTRDCSSSERECLGRGPGGVRILAAPKWKARHGGTHYSTSTWEEEGKEDFRSLLAASLAAGPGPQGDKADRGREDTWPPPASQACVLCTHISHTSTQVFFLKKKKRLY